MHSRTTRRALMMLVTLSATLTPPAGSLRAQQHGGAPARPMSAAPKEAEQFAFLVGQWEVTVIPRVSSLAARIHGQPKLLGSWKAWKAFDGFGIEDELRIIDASGNPSALTHTVRMYDAVQSRWSQTSLDVYRARFSAANGTFANGALTLRSVGRDAEGKPFVQRVRFYDITATSFKWQADRSTDGERTWDEAYLRMEAKRVAASAPR
jgi:hypothetical protein